MMEVNEQYSQEARIQLDFFSFMSIALWVCFGVAVTSGIVMHLLVITVVDSPEVETSMFLYTSVAYAFLGLILSILGAAFIYPLYKFWCNKKRGLYVTGYFAFIRRDV